MPALTAAATRRRCLTVAVFAALSLFVALVAASSLRPEYAAASLPEPAAWTHRTDAPAQASPEWLPTAAAISVGHSAHGRAPGLLPTHQKPFLSMWMTRELPDSDASSSYSDPDWLALPVSFASSESPPGVAFSAAPSSATVRANRDTLTQLCISRC
jgi:hypothetical protein